MAFPDVLALEVNDALRILEQAGYTCEVTVTEPPKKGACRRKALLPNMWLDSESCITIKQQSLL